MNKNYLLVNEVHGFKISEWRFFHQRVSTRKLLHHLYILLFVNTDRSFLGNGFYKELLKLYIFALFIRFHFREKYGKWEATLDIIYGFEFWLKFNLCYSVLKLPSNILRRYLLRYLRRDNTLLDTRHDISCIAAIYQEVLMRFVERML